MARAINLSPLYERWKAALAGGRGIALSAEELDQISIMGAFDLLSEAVAHSVLAQVRARLDGQTHTHKSKADVKAGGDPDFVPAAFSVQMLAERWHVSTGSVYALIKSGKLKSMKLGGQLYRVPRGEVEAFERDYVLDGEKKI